MRKANNLNIVGDNAEPSPGVLSLAEAAFNNKESWGALADRVLDAVAEAYRMDTAQLLAKMNAKAGDANPKRDAWGKVQASPLTLPGLAIAGGAYALDKATGGRSHFQVEDNALQLVDAPLMSAPFTLGNVQIYPEGQGPDTIARSYNGQPMRRGDHEAAHTAQAQRLGGIPMGLLWLRGGGQSARNPVEMDADAYVMSHRSRHR